MVAGQSRAVLPGHTFYKIYQILWTKFILLGGDIYRIAKKFSDLISKEAKSYYFS